MITRPISLGRATFAVLPLYVAFGALLGFIQTALPAILQREGVPLTLVGFATLLFLPFGLSALWAPLVDRYGSERFGRRRGWILVCQGIVVAALLICAALEPHTAMLLLLPMGVAAATMDVALDGFLVETARDDAERALRGPLKVGGVYGGMLIGSTAILAIYERLGWTNAILVLAALALLAPLGFARDCEPGGGGRLRRPWPTLSALTRRPKGLRLVVSSVALGSALGLGISGFRLLLVAIGLPLASIGVAFGVAGGLAAIVGAAFAGVLGRTLGSSATLAASGTGLALLLSLAAAAGTAFPATGLIASAFVAACYAAYAILYSALCALAMRTCASDQAATDYAIVQSGWTLAGIAGGVLSGLAVAALGWPAVFLVAALGVATSALVASTTRSATPAVEGGRP
ncbi:MFS transporter [Methylobacterium sp. Leaf85]|uniref:MFS transporter n=1 Tax=Methylobacterium sp. Leaf85 TaxID=1736241 RepID=UPI0006F63026|nr:MFS transporter [Methylobacterium sp. Leaf85]KQO52206.1 hypothetical protein ASF08_21670 [Methylobacterium sp. Leaf85]